MALDLRSFLDRVRIERPADLVEVSREVSPRHETAAILTRLEERQRFPILFFRKVKGSPFPLVTNVCGSMARLALALDCPLRLVGERYAEACEHRCPPEVVNDGPVRENVLRGAAVDLRMLPQLFYHEGDSENPYVTAAIVAARDPDTGKTNLSYHRLMIAARDRAGIFMERGKHLDGIYRKYVRRGLPMPIGVFIGVHPLVSLGALYSGSSDVEEYDVVGGLARAPLPVVECVSQEGIFVPAHAELVLEGSVSVSETIVEGPFGEFTGYGTGTAPTPVFDVSAMTFRNGCIYQDVVSGHMEHLILPMPALEQRMLSVARRTVRGVTRVSLVAPFTTVVALDKVDDAEPRAVIEALLRSDIYSKQVIVVDSDVQTVDLRSILGAMALNMQATTGVHVFPDEQGTRLDPSCTNPDGRVAKMGIDATRALAPVRPVTRNAIPRSVLDQVDLAELLPRPADGKDAGRSPRS